jgi:hypothetical protein
MKCLVALLRGVAMLCSGVIVTVLIIPTCLQVIGGLDFEDTLIGRFLDWLI